MLCACLLSTSGSVDPAIPQQQGFGYSGLPNKKKVIWLWLVIYMISINLIYFMLPSKETLKPVAWSMWQKQIRHKPELCIF